MELRGTQQDLMMLLSRPGSDVAQVVKTLARIPSQLLYPQQALLYVLATKQRHVGGQFLDIGTGAGHSAALMASVGMGVHVVTLEPRPRAIARASAYLAGFGNVQLLQEASWDYLKRYEGPELAMVFVDGDHKRVARDMGWYQKLMRDGLILFHDYTPSGAVRQCPNVWAEVNKMAEWAGQNQPDVMMILADDTGMAGFYRR